MDNKKLISLGKFILLGYYLPMVAMTLIPAILSLDFRIIMMAFVAPLWIMANGLPMTAWFGFDQFWEWYAIFAVSGLAFLAGLYFHGKTWGKVLVLAGLWGWTIISILAIGLHY